MRHIQSLVDMSQHQWPHWFTCLQQLPNIQRRIHQLVYAKLVAKEGAGSDSVGEAQVDETPPPTTFKSTRGKGRSVKPRARVVKKK